MGVDDGERMKSKAEDGGGGERRNRRREGTAPGDNRYDKALL